LKKHLLTRSKPWSSFWNFDDGVDSISTNSYKTIEINVTHPIRATQLAIDSFTRQKLGHGVVVIISSIAAQVAPLPTPMYAASKHAMSGFTRSLANLEPTINIRVNAVAPGIVKTPIWTEDKLKWIKESEDTWVTPARVAEVMLDLVQKEEYVGGTVLEIGAENPRRVEARNDPGPQGKGHSVSNVGGVVANVYKLISEKFGK
jgi:3-hydroxybutyrate dehydrogenase